MLFFGGHVLKAKERIKYFLEKESKNSFVQSQKKWFNDNGYSDLIYLLDDDLRKRKRIYLNLLMANLYAKDAIKNIQDY